VTTLLVDGNLDGHAGLLLGRLWTEDWKLFCDHLELRVLYLEDVGLRRESPDDVVWPLCQEQGYYLLTANRNMESDDSLEATIRREGTESSLPVFTIADADRLYDDSAYLKQVVDKLLQFLLYAQDYRGAGRLYMP
jgi:hypothetical protein